MAFFEPIFGWLVPALGYVIDKITVATTKPEAAPPKPKHPEPHRDPINGKIIIENWKLYKEDLFNYGAIKTQEWVQQGKYNLKPEELEKELEQYKKDLYKKTNPRS